MIVTIRPYQPDDAPALRQIFFSAIHETASRDYSPVQVNAWAPEQYDPAQWAQRLAGIQPFIAEIAGQAVGYTDVQADGYIDHFYVAASVVRQGVGSALMRHILDLAAQRQLPALYADVSLTARPFFEHWGFVVEEERHPVANGVEFTNFRMRKALSTLPTD